jgi:hypothetical protein
MKIISAKNEYPLIPDIGDNLKLSPQEQFKIIMKKVNTSLRATEWTSFDEDGRMVLNNEFRIKQYIVRLENAEAVILVIDGKERPIEIDDIASDEIEGLFDLTTQVTDRISKLDDDRGKNKKK